MFKAAITIFLIDKVVYNATMCYGRHVTWLCIMQLCVTDSM